MRWVAAAGLRARERQVGAIMSDLDGYEAKTHVAGVIELVRGEMITPHMRRITLRGEALKGLERYWRAEMLIRLYFPPKGGVNPPEPYLTADGVLSYNTTPETEVSPFSAYSEDPLVRAYTARAYRPENLEIDIDFVLHEAAGLASDWARAAKPGDRLGIVEFEPPPSQRPASQRQADAFVMFADEAGIPAILTNLEEFPAGAKVYVFIEVADAAEEQPYKTKADATVVWLHRSGAKPGENLLVEAAKSMNWPSGDVYVTCCAEIKTGTLIRRHIRDDRGVKKGWYKTQAYWRLGKTEVERMERMTQLSLAAAETDPSSFIDSFNEAGMNVVDPTLFE